MSGCARRVADHQIEKRERERESKSSSSCALLLSPAGWVSRTMSLRRRRDGWRHHFVRAPSLLRGEAPGVWVCACEALLCCVFEREFVENKEKMSTSKKFVRNFMRWYGGKWVERWAKKKSMTKCSVGFLSREDPPLVASCLVQWIFFPPRKVIRRLGQLPHLCTPIRRAHVAPSGSHAVHLGCAHHLTTTSVRARRRECSSRSP